MGQSAYDYYYFTTPTPTVDYPVATGFLISKYHTGATASQITFYPVWALESMWQYLKLPKADMIL